MERNQSVYQLLHCDCCQRDGPGVAWRIKCADPAQGFSFVPSPAFHLNRQLSGNAAKEMKRRSKEAGCRFNDSAGSCVCASKELLNVLAGCVRNAGAAAASYL